MSQFTPTRRTVRVLVPQDSIADIFDECDRHPTNETGGRLLGGYDKIGQQLVIQVTGILGPGPNARRTPTSFFQDGEHQERIFRAIEDRNPGIEHLGNWHTHHVNGLERLSGGDIDTYHRIVNSENHNPDIFVAFLVTKKLSGPARYALRFYMLLRGNEKVFEIPETAVTRIAITPVWRAQP